MVIAIGTASRHRRRFGSMSMTIVSLRGWPDEPEGWPAAEV